MCTRKVDQTEAAMITIRSGAPISAVPRTCFGSRHHIQLSCEIGRVLLGKRHCPKGWGWMTTARGDNKYLTGHSTADTKSTVERTTKLPQAHCAIVICDTMMIQAREEANTCQFWGTRMTDVQLNAYTAIRLVQMCPCAPNASNVQLVHPCHLLFQSHALFPKCSRK